MKELISRVVHYPVRRKLRRAEIELDGAKNSLQQDPKNPGFHRRLANIYQGLNRWVSTLAALRSSLFLDEGNIETQRHINQVQQQIDNMDPISHDHNQYFRFKTLADHSKGLFDPHDFSLLDVGGGEGWLAYFLPEARYMLADPVYNGIDGNNLPFQPASFDLVVACHVLEHIPESQRKGFMEKLCSIAGKYVLLLNPFAMPGSAERERLELVLEITGHKWAREHLDCTLPELSWIEDYAASRGYATRSFPNGCLTSTLAFTFLDSFSKNVRGDDMKRINRFFNSRFIDKMNHAEFPTAYLVEIKVD